MAVKPGRDGLDGLVVAAVHFERFVHQPVAHQPRRAASPCRPRPRAPARAARAAAPPGCAASAPAICDGMSCTSVPPQATFSTWMPRQIAKIGRLRLRAQRQSARSRTRLGPAPPPRPWRARASPYLDGATSPPPVSMRPSMPARPASTAIDESRMRAVRRRREGWTAGSPRASGTLRCQ